MQKGRLEQLFDEVKNRFSGTDYADTKGRNTKGIKTS